MATESAREAYLPLYVGDFLASTLEWDGEEQALYLQLLAYQWSTGSLPADADKLVRMVRWEPAAFARCWATVSAKFEARDGRLVNPRLEEHRARARELIERKSEVGRKAAQRRWARPDAEAQPAQSDEHSEGNADADANAMPTHSVSNADAMPTHCQRNANQTKPREELELLSIQDHSDNKPSSASPTAIPADVRRVFEHWRTTHGHPRAVLDAKRQRTIRNALKRYTADDLCRSIAGYLNSPHHMGQNANGTKYDDIGLFLRDAAHVDAGLRLADRPAGNGASRLTQRNVAAVDGWVPPELRGKRDAAG